MKFVFAAFHTLACLAWDGHRCKTGPVVQPPPAVIWVPIPPPPQPDPDPEGDTVKWKPRYWGDQIAKTP